MDEVTLQAQVRDLLAGVFSLDSCDEIKGGDSLIADLKADSLDFVEILHLVERRFGVKIQSDEIMLAGSGKKLEEFFADGRLTAEASELLRGALPAKSASIVPGMGRLAFFSLFTVDDLVCLIRQKLPGGQT